MSEELKRTPDAGPQDVREALEAILKKEIDVFAGPEKERNEYDDGLASGFNSGFWFGVNAASAETQRLKRQVDVLRSAVNLVRKQDSLRGSALMAAMDEALAAADKIAKE